MNWLGVFWPKPNNKKKKKKKNHSHNGARSLYLVRGVFVRMDVFPSGFVDEIIHIWYTLPKLAQNTSVIVWQSGYRLTGLRA